MNETFDVTNWTVDLQDTSAGHAYEGFQDGGVLTTQDVLELCGAMDGNALLAAGIGLVVTLLYLFYVRRWRAGIKESQRVFLDKALLTLIALMFVTVIVRIARAG